MADTDFPTFAADDVVCDGATSADYLRPAALIDADHQIVRAFAAEHADSSADPRARVVSLYYAVRDLIYYDPYGTPFEAAAYKASATITTGHGFCVNKAGVLAAVARASGIPARVGYADVRNHMTTKRLADLMGTDIFYFHGYTDLWLDGRWVKATPAFNKELTDKFRLQPLEFDGREDSIYHPFDLGGRRHMEYLAYRGVYADIPFETIRACFHHVYPHMKKSDGATPGGNFAAEGEAEAKAAART